MSLERPDWSAIPAPENDGAADHLAGQKIPVLSLNATNGESIDLSSLAGLTVLYIYPMTGRPDRALPNGWDMIPGARGCTPQSCSFRDHFAELISLGVNHLFGLSTQDKTWQQEAVQRLHLPFPLLSDEKLEFANALTLPTFEADHKLLIKRMSMTIIDGVIDHVFYPIFPPDQDAENMIAHLKSKA